MAEHKFHKGEQVSWNSEAGRVSGHIIQVHTKDFKVNGYTRHCTPEDPQYAIKSNISDHVAHHFGKGLTRIK